MKKAGIGLLLALLVMSTGCATEPWVKPYEREALSQEIMLFSREPLVDQYRLHVFEVREAARGAALSVGGGCGCN